MKAIPIIALAIIVFIVFFFFGTIKTTDRNIAHYLDGNHYIDAYATDVMPDLDTLPVYEDIRYQYHKERSFFLTETVLLVVTYDEATYETEKEKLDESYTFLDHIAYYSFKDRVEKDKYFIPEYEFSINSYNFRVIDEEIHGLWYPKYFGMIATSDEKNSIAYLYFADGDLDYISKAGNECSMQEFVNEYYRYRW